MVVAGHRRGQIRRARPRQALLEQLGDAVVDGGLGSRLADHAIARHAPAAADSNIPALSLYDHVVAAQAEEPLLEDGIAPVPEGQGEAEPAAAVGEPEQAVLPETVGPRPGVVGRGEPADAR